jgi:P4 family phage/plasmid primase-like protien
VFDRGDHVEIAARLIERLGARDQIVADEGRLWKHAYSTFGVWSEIDRAHLSRSVQGFAGAPVGEKEKPLGVSSGDVYGAIKLALDQLGRPGFFDSAPPGIAFSDCFVRVGDEGLEVLPSGPDHRARASYPFALARGAVPSRWVAFLDSVFRDDEDRVAKVSFVQEFFGACVLGVAPKYQRACVALGEGDNGKSVLANVGLSCMPPGTTTAIPPQSWGHEYYRADFVGKLINVLGELPEREIIASDAFKAIVSGDPITGRLIREAPTTFRPRAGHYFAANRLPGTSDQSEGFWRRFVVLTFNRSFKGDPERDPDIVTKILAERPAIVGWMLDGAARLVQAKDYTIPRSHHAALAEWRKNADQVACFIEAEMRPLAVDDPLAWGTTGASLYSAYAEWCRTNGHRALASNRFAERMKGLGLAATKTKRGMVYPVARLSAVDRVQAGAGWVQGHPSPETLGGFDA